MEKDKSPLNEYIDFWNITSDTYKQTVVTPFYNSESSASFIKNIKKILLPYQNNKTRREISTNILEMGCGNGYLLPYLRTIAKSNGKVYACDISDTMLERAKIAKNNSNPENSNSSCEPTSSQNINFQDNVILCKANNSALPFPDNSFDNVFTINSFLSPDRTSYLLQFNEARRVLKKNGLFVGLFPSNENYLKQLYFAKEHCISKNMSEQEALVAVYTEFNKRLYDPVGGFVNFEDSKFRIKLYSQFELENILSSHSFDIKNISAFTYPKSMVDELGLIFGKSGIFDWLVLATKKSE